MVVEGLPLVKEAQVQLVLPFHSLMLPQFLLVEGVGNSFPAHLGIFGVEFNAKVVESEVSAYYPCGACPREGVKYGAWFGVGVAGAGWFPTNRLTLITH